MGKKFDSDLPGDTRVNYIGGSRIVPIKAYTQERKVDVYGKDKIFGLSDKDLENIAEYIKMKAHKYPFEKKDVFVRQIDLKNFDSKRRGFVYAYLWNAEYKGRVYSINLSVLNSYKDVELNYDGKNLEVYFEVFSNHGADGTKYQNTYSHVSYDYNYAWVREAIDEVFKGLQNIWDNPNTEKEMKWGI